MGELERAVVQVSVEDVIRILEESPGSGHFLPHIRFAEVLNRVSIAHISIEKALKFLIRESSGKIIYGHHLGHRFGELKEQDPASAEFLEGVFEAARLHYGINHKSKGMDHFRTLDAYLNTTGSEDAFNKNYGIRYWELYPTLENALLHQVHLSIHAELLHGLHEILIEPDRDKETVGARVERAVETAIFQSYGPSVGQAIFFIEWLNQFATRREAMANAVRRSFAFDNPFATEITSAAYKALLEAKDPAVRHFASTLDVLPRQSRDVFPDVEWLDGKARQKGKVITPSGEALGFIEQGPHGRWYITPIQPGPIGVSAKTENQKDAICYLGQLLTSPARVTCDGVVSSLRIVGKDRNVFKDTRKKPRILDHDIFYDEAEMYRIDFWEESHGIEVGREVVIESIRDESQGPTLTDKLSGEVREVVGHQVFVVGRAVSRIGFR
jgi:hypothetical protein